MITGLFISFTFYVPPILPCLLLQHNARIAGLIYNTKEKCVFRRFTSITLWWLLASVNKQGTLILCRGGSKPLICDNGGRRSGSHSVSFIGIILCRICTVVSLDLWLAIMYFSVHDFSLQLTYFKWHMKTNVYDS
jgi:hypothetical protein